MEFLFNISFFIKGSYTQFIKALDWVLKKLKIVRLSSQLIIDITVFYSMFTLCFKPMKILIYLFFYFIKFRIFNGTARGRLKP